MEYLGGATLVEELHHRDGLSRFTALPHFLLSLCPSGVDKDMVRQLIAGSMDISSLAPESRTSSLKKGAFGHIPSLGQKSSEYTLDAVLIVPNRCKH